MSIRGTEIAVVLNQAAISSSGRLRSSRSLYLDTKYSDSLSVSVVYYVGNTHLTFLELESFWFVSRSPSVAIASLVYRELLRVLQSSVIHLFRLRCSSTYISQYGKETRSRWVWH